MLTKDTAMIDNIVASTNTDMISRVARDFPCVDAIIQASKSLQDLKKTENEKLAQ
jgi:hypothetical protein